MFMRRVGLPENAFEMRVKNFSKGMRQKLGITIAIIKDAPNILLDEPTSGLDPKAAAEFIKILKGLRDQGKSILMCTHDIFRAKEIADHVGIMKEADWSCSEAARNSLRTIWKRCTWNTCRKRWRERSTSSARQESEVGSQER